MNEVDQLRALAIYYQQRALDLEQRLVIANADREAQAKQIEALQDTNVESGTGISQNVDVNIPNS